MVVNEAHAWVEVYDAKIWHRIDLGGAAANLDFTPEIGKPSYIPPPDPYAWPEQRDSGQDVADKVRQLAEQAAQKKAEQQGDDPERVGERERVRLVEPERDAEQRAERRRARAEGPARRSSASARSTTTSGAACRSTFRASSRPAACPARTSASTWC